MSFISDFQQAIKKQKQRGRCLHFNDGNRCDQFISAHSIQKSGQLSLIAENGHVYRINADLSTLFQTNGIPQPKKIGIKKVSTFNGFCKHHDNSLFEPIDNNPLEPTQEQIEEQLVLYAYRCICRELFVKENTVIALGNLENHPELDYEYQRFLKSSRAGHFLGLERLKYHKHYYDEALAHKNYEEFECVYFTSTSICSLQLSGLLYPHFDFTGQQLQDLLDLSSPLDLITFFTAPTSNGWCFGFVWHKSSNVSCTSFLQSFALRIQDGENIEDALLRFSFSCCENHAFRISWWDRLSENAKEALIARFCLGAFPRIPIPPNYLVEGCEGIADWTFEYVGQSQNFFD